MYVMQNLEKELEANTSVDELMERADFERYNQISEDAEIDSLLAKREAHLKHKAAYDAVYDAYYHVDSGEWLEEICGDEECEYCCNRPAKHI
jgi:hypothetical protein